ncbi:MAG: DoxX family protein [Elusimicrobiota bacterium]
MNDKKMTWAGRALTALCLPPFLMGAFMMITKNPEALEGMVKMGWPASAVNTILTLELVSLILYLIPQTAVLGAVLLTGYLGGAVATHLRAGEAPTAAVVVGVIVWAGLWLREPRLRALMPFRKAP